MPSPTTSRGAARWILPLLLVAAFALAGCSDGDGAGAESNPPATPTPLTPTTDPAYDLSPEQVVTELAADDADLTGDEARSTVAAGEPQSEQEPPTLSYCSQPLVNEDSRIQRLEVRLTDGDQVHATIDAAVYDPGRAMAALRELRAGEMACGSGLVAPLRWEAAAEPATWSTKDLASSVTGKLTNDHWAKTVTRTPAGGEPEVTIVIAQRRGDAVVVVSSPDQARALELAATVKQRLAKTDSHLIDD